MCLACAHPVKFQETVEKAVGNNIKYDKNIEFLNDEEVVNLIKYLKYQLQYVRSLFFL